MYVQNRKFLFFFTLSIFLEHDFEQLEDIWFTSAPNLSVHTVEVKYKYIVNRNLNISFKNVFFPSTFFSYLWKDALNSKVLVSSAVGH